MGLFDFIVSGLGSSTSSTNSFLCPHCNKRTQHVRISLTEYSKVQDPDSTFDTIGAKYLDVIQFTKLVNVMGITHYKCSECGLTTIRKSDGTLDTIGKFGK